MGFKDEVEKGKDNMEINNVILIDEVFQDMTIEVSKNIMDYKVIIEQVLDNGYDT